MIHKLDADVLMLQEVDDGVPRSNHDSQVDVLGELLGMKHRSWFPNVDVRGGGRYGNAILSRYPLIESTNIDLSIRWKKKRSCLHGVIRVRHDDVDRTVHVFNMHLGLARFERRIQLRMFLDSHPFAAPAPRDAGRRRRRPQRRLRRPRDAAPARRAFAASSGAH